MKRMILHAAFVVAMSCAATASFATSFGYPGALQSFTAPAASLYLITAAKAAGG